MAFSKAFERELNKLFKRWVAHSKFRVFCEI